ncbi:PepSY domain-containing protein [Dysgonomonas sp. Marseille-P4361]|uniref:PepSY-associated TM helix domain-containing protein n=1 Tax=Dysgonomonas sp. Marseille-P4361 TaxID=2161820 RepID=UPI000D552365|nr:PepSY-associated TM helix domain-containing protein [Dysgonomonas sp. Marseille-P4361]
MKKLFAKIHLWLSIPFGIIIAIACLSGAILVFENEILELSYPSHYFVEEVKDKPLPIEDLMKLGREQLPDSVKINGIRVTDDPERTYQLVLPGKKSAAFIDPYTGKVTGISNGQGFFMQTMRLHRWLLDTNKRDGSLFLGKELMGYATLFFVFILISGLIIWTPRSMKGLKHRLKIKTNAGWRRFFYDLHVVGGFYSALLLLVLSLTGLTWSFNWYRDAFYTVFGVETSKSAAVSGSESSEKQKGDQNKNNSPEKLLAEEQKKNQEDTEKSEVKKQGGKGERGKKGLNTVHWDEVLSSLQNRYAEFNSITIQDGSATVSTAKYGNTRGSDRFSFDSGSGKITGEQLYKDLPKSGKIRGWIYSVHVGTWGGITTRILSCLVSVLGAVFVITGYYFWIKKIFKKRSKRK